MNYSKNTSENDAASLKVANRQSRNKKRTRNMIVSWIVILVIGMLIGSGFSRIGQVKTTETIQQFSEVEPYGTIDGKTFNWGLSSDWTSGAELGFIPLEVGLDEDIQEFIYCLSYGYNLDFTFVMGLIQTESTFNSDIVSSTNDYGLMQINTINHEWLKEKLGITDFLDPYQNTRSGIYILRNLFEKYEDPEKVLMAYNLGETGAKKLWNKGIYETDYTKKVLNNIEQFKNYINERNEENE
ncbi:transglycosylase SLT domain-containing protein [Vallitalea guaymasensis]|uniref:transglycosylase SLT domain-containing protein n=1 Tax=Vallitalea guaymasensis TaxID=1185412 RepID=UPI001FA8A13C|nr:transglycosylase SLT domain-containing protein [Vallitalea guaymasensis]